MTFRCSYGFAVLWTIACILGGWAISFWILSAFQRNRRYDECTTCAIRRIFMDRMKTKRLTCHKPTSPYITPSGCGLPEEATNVPQRAGTILEVKLKGAIIEQPHPAPVAVTGPDAGTPGQTPPSNEGKGAGHTL
jgi:hypothetical protein